MVEFSLYNPLFDLSFLKQTPYVELVIIRACSGSALVVSVKCERRVVMTKPNPAQIYDHIAHSKSV